MKCNACGAESETLNAWLRIGPHSKKPLVRLNLCIECGEALEKLINGWKEKGLSPRQLVPRQGDEQTKLEVKA